MKTRNILTVALVVIAGFWERVAYYGFRQTAFTRAYAEHADSGETIRTLMRLGSITMIVGFLIGGGLSLATRSRFLLVGAAVFLGLVHVAGALSPQAGVIAIPLASGILRPLTYVAIAEEIDQEARIWKTVVAATLVYGAANAGALCASSTSFAFGRAQVIGLAIPVFGAVLCLVFLSVVAFALPGQPFNWSSNETLVAPDPQHATYRPTPAVARGAGSPNPLILVLAIGASCLASCQAAAQGDAVDAVARSGSLARLAWLYSLNPAIVLVVGIILAGIGLFLASTRSGFAPTWYWGAGLGLHALGGLTAMVATIANARGVAISATVLDAFGEGLAAPIALAYVLGTLRSRWVGAAGAGLSIAGAVSSLMMLPLRGQPGLVTPALGLFGLLTLIVALAVTILGPRLHQNA